MGKFIKETAKCTSIVLALSLGAFAMFAGCNATTEKSDSQESIEYTNEDTYGTSTEIQNSTVEVTSITSESDITTVETTETTTVNNEGSGVNISTYITQHKAYPPMWKVTDNSGNIIYMLGTMHLATEYTFPLPDEVYDVYNKSDGVAVEYDIKSLQSNLSEAMKLTKPLMYTDGTTIKDHISEEAYNIGKEKIKNYGTWSETLNYLKPSYWLDIMQSMSVNSIQGISEDGIDMTFINKAYEDNKPVISIETLETQGELLGMYSDAMVEFILLNDSESLDCTEETVKQMAELYNAWASGDLDKTLELAGYDETAIDLSDTDDIPDELLKEASEYNKILLDDRNKVMVDRAEEFMRNGNNYFYMVGTLHYLGENGIISLLENDGYTVERVEYKR